jgi:uncharacterized protein with NRDE domain
MCLVALFYRVVEDAPVIVGANREEFYVRGGEPPQLFDGTVRMIGGRDPVAGGTWLGVNEFGVLVAVTNRRRSEKPRELRSRGLLLRDMLGCTTAAEATQLASQELSRDRYDGCNFLAVDQNSATVLHGGDWLRVRTLPPGLHVLANSDVNDASDRRVRYVLDGLGQWTYGCADHCVAALRDVCGQTGDPPVCLRFEHRGTVSSSILVLRPDLSRSTYLHAQGPPDRTPFVDCSALFRHLIEKRISL